MLLVEIFIVCVLFFLLCYCNTGGDKKNIKSFSSYPDEIQQIVRENPILRDKIKMTKPHISFISNILIFTVLFVMFGLFMKKDSFIGNFINIMILGQSLNLFDFLAIDMLWWRNSKRIRFAGTEHMDNLYKNPKKHVISFIKGIVAFFLVAIIAGLVLVLI